MPVQTWGNPVGGVVWFLPHDLLKVLDFQQGTRQRGASQTDFQKVFVYYIDLWFEGMSGKSQKKWMIRSLACLLHSIYTRDPNRTFSWLQWLIHYITRWYIQKNLHHDSNQDPTTGYMKVLLSYVRIFEVDEIWSFNTIGTTKHF